MEMIIQRVLFPNRIVCLLRMIQDEIFNKEPQVWFLSILRYPFHRNFRNNLPTPLIIQIRLTKWARILIPFLLIIQMSIHSIHFQCRILHRINYIQMFVVFFVFIIRCIRKMPWLIKCQTFLVKMASYIVSREAIMSIILPWCWMMVVLLVLIKSIMFYSIHYSYSDLHAKWEYQF